MKRKEKNRSTRKVEKSKTAFSKENGSFVLCGFIGFIGAAKILDLYQVFSLCPI